MYCPRICAFLRWQYTMCLCLVVYVYLSMTLYICLCLLVYVCLSMSNCKCQFEGGSWFWIVYATKYEPHGSIQLCELLTQNVSGQRIHVAMLSLTLGQMGLNIVLSYSPWIEVKFPSMTRGVALPSSLRKYFTSALEQYQRNSPRCLPPWTTYHLEILS